MTKPDRIRRQLTAGEFEFSRHALARVVERNISTAEIQQAAANADVIEDYPDDKYSPSALMLGFTANGRPLHFQVSYAESDMCKIITIYEPDPTEWVDYRTRK